MDKPLLYYGISGKLEQKINDYTGMTGEPLAIIENEENAAKYRGTKLYGKYDVVTLDEALEQYPDPEIWVTYPKAINTARMIATKVDPHNIHFFEADLEYRLGCGFLGHFISYRMESFSPCCIVSKYPTVKVTGSVEKRLEKWKQYETELIDDLRCERQNPCSGCPHLTYNFWHKTVKLNTISFGSCQPGDVCNYKCVYCFAEQHLNNPKSVTDGYTTYEVIKTLSFMPEFKTSDMWINIANGEFTANRDCDLMLDVLMKMPWKTTFLTNGSIYREKFTEYLKTGRVQKVQASIDAGTRETYHKVKGLDAFDKVRENLQKYGLANLDSFILKYIFLEGLNDNQADVDGFIDFCQDVGCKKITISSDLFKPFTPEIKKLIVRMLKRAKKYGIHLQRNMSYVTKADARFLIDNAEKLGIMDK